MASDVLPVRFVAMCAHVRYLLLESLGRRRDLPCGTWLFLTECAHDEWGREDGLWQGAQIRHFRQKNKQIFAAVQTELSFCRRINLTGIFALYD